MPPSERESSGSRKERVKTAKHYWAITWAPIVFGCAALFYAFLFFRTPDVYYRSSDENWADYEINFQGKNFERMVYNFEGYKVICKAPGAILYRTTAKNWFNIFAWANYFQDRKWHVAYAPPVERITRFYPHYDMDKHCYNDEWTPEILEQTKKGMDRYLRDLDARIAHTR